MRIGSIVIACYNFDKMLAFWQEALNYIPREPARGGWVVLLDPKRRKPNVSLNQVQKNSNRRRSRLHLDLYSDNREAEVERLIKIGATRYPWKYNQGADFVVLEDPDSNLFCVVQVKDYSLAFISLSRSNSFLNRCIIGKLKDDLLC